MAAEKSGVFGPDSPIVINRVLIVDDNAHNCELVAEWLMADGFDAEWHTSAEGALRAMEGKDFGVVVTDFHMLGMSGGELCRRIMETRWDIPVIVVSGFGGPEIVQEVLRAGAYDFMAKPVALELRRWPSGVRSSAAHFSAKSNDCVAWRETTAASASFMESARRCSAHTTPWTRWLVAIPHC